MSEYLDDDFADDETPNKKDPVRSRLNELEKQNKKLADANAEFVKKLSEYQVRDVLAERGLTDKRALSRASRWMKADGVDLADQKAIDGWLEDNGDAFGYSKQEEEPEETRAAREGLDRMHSVENQGIPVNRQQEILADISNATPETMASVLAKYSDLKM